MSVIHKVQVILEHYVEGRLIAITREGRIGFTGLDQDDPNNREKVTALTLVLIDFLCEHMKEQSIEETAALLTAYKVLAARIDRDAIPF